MTEKPCMQERLFIWIKQNVYVVVVSLILVSFFLIWITKPDSLTINLFSSSIFLWLTVVIVEKLLERTKLQRNEQSIAYVNSKIFGICHDLIYELNPPKDLMQILATEDQRQKFYLSRIKALKKSAVHELESVIIAHFHLIKPELRNDILNLASCLEILKTYQYTSKYTHPGLLAILRRDIAEHIFAIMWQSVSIIRKYNLHNYGRILKTKWKKGEPPEVRLIPTKPESCQAVLTELESIVNEAMKIRYNECLNSSS